MNVFKHLFITIIIFFASLTFVHTVFAVQNPLSVPNNKIGIHILFPQEIIDAAKLVNANGGDWGYVTIPIQTGDKDLQKWQHFMDDAGKLHVIPIIRLATEGDYFNTKVWRKPQYTDILDFANFLDSLTWPTKNRYIIIFNETNRANEWGGDVNPSGYADMLRYAVTVFKARNQNFFIISAGLDNAAANSADAMNEYDYMWQMSRHIPDIFDEVDGIASHSYPNPGFSVPPTVITSESIGSFQFEKNFIRRFSTRDLPVFITETGWSKDVVSESTIAQYFKTAFSDAWSDSHIVTVTPFLLSANSGVFTQFSLLNNNAPGAMYSALFELPKVKGTPALTTAVLALVIKSESVEIKTFEEKPAPFEKETTFIQSSAFKTVLKWILHL